MKRTHSDSHLLPYEYRQQQQIKTNKLPASTPQDQEDSLSILPEDLLVRIFAHSSSSYPCLRSLALTCRSFKMAVYSDAFKNLFLESHSIPLKLKDTEPWMKTYRLWLQTKCYILWDINANMHSFIPLSRIVHQIAKKVFSNRWCGGVTLGIYTLQIKYYKIFNEADYTSAISKAFPDIYGPLDTFGAPIAPILQHIYESVNKQPLDNATAAEVHVFSVYKYDPNDIVSFLRDSKNCLQPLNIYFYALDIKEINSLNFFDKLKSLQPQILKMPNRPSFSLIQSSEYTEN
jgi:hypothetical protein